MSRLIVVLMLVATLTSLLSGSVSSQTALQSRFQVHERIDGDIDAISDFHALTNGASVSTDVLLTGAQSLRSRLDESLSLYRNRPLTDDGEWERRAVIVFNDLTRYRYALLMYLSSLSAGSMSGMDSAVTEANREWLQFSRDYEALLARFNELELTEENTNISTVVLWCAILATIIVAWFWRKSRLLFRRAVVESSTADGFEATARWQIARSGVLPAVFAWLAGIAASDGTIGWLFWVALSIVFLTGWRFAQGLWLYYTKGLSMIQNLRTYDDYPQAPRDLRPKSKIIDVYDPNGVTPFDES